MRMHARARAHTHTHTRARSFPLPVWPHPCRCIKDGVDAPIPHRAQYSLMDVDVESGFLSLLTDEGESKEDVCLSRAADEASAPEYHVLICCMFATPRVMRGLLDLKAIGSSF